MNADEIAVKLNTKFTPLLEKIESQRQVECNNLMSELKKNLFNCQVGTCVDFSEYYNLNRCPDVEKFIDNFNMKSRLKIDRSRNGFNTMCFSAKDDSIKIVLDYEDDDIYD